MSRVYFVLVAVVVLSWHAQVAEAAGPRVLGEGKQPGDVRLQPLKDLNGYFPFEVPRSKEEWEARAAKVKRQIALSQGIWPTPERTPLNAVVHGRIDKGDYTVEKVFFESVPGFFVTGNLYRPKNKTLTPALSQREREGKKPGVLFAHGHWNDGRFIDVGRTAVRKEIVIGSERFEEGGRSLMQSLPVQIARMGCVCFHYDMIGYADSQQLSFDLGHRFNKQRPEMNNAQSWGLFSPQAEAHLQSIMGLQTWGSVRALDFLLELPDVDASRIAITGASGGGTQTMLLSGIDPRVTVSFPAVMVSTAMQGGCTCENASCLRVGTGNIEFAALFAPKPLGMTAANDWTKEMATKGFPELQSLYTLLEPPAPSEQPRANRNAERQQGPRNLELFANTHFQHNYNYVSRSCLYGFLNKHFKLGLEEPVVEEDYERLTREQMSVWDAAHPQPPSGPEFERKLCRELADASRRQLEALVPKDTASLAKWREVVGGAVETIVGRGLPAASELEFEKSDESDKGAWIQFAGLLKNKGRGEELPVVFLHPKNWNGRAVIWLNEQGKGGLFADDGSPAADTRRLLEAGISVAGADLLYQGEFLAQGAAAEKNRTVRNTREFAGYTYGYNYPLLAQRAHDVLSLVAFVKHHHDAAKSVELVALDGTAPVVATALAMASGAVSQAAINTAGFRFGKLSDYLDASFLPGGAKYGDLPGILSLAAPTKLWLSGESEQSAGLVKRVYRASGAERAIVVEGSGEGVKGKAVEWLVKGQ